MRQGAENLGIGHVFAGLPEVLVVVANAILHADRQLLDAHELVNDFIAAFKRGACSVAVGDQNWNVTDDVSVKGHPGNLCENGEDNLLVVVLRWTVVPVTDSGHRGDRPVEGAQVHLKIGELPSFRLRDGLLN